MTSDKITLLVFKWCFMLYLYTDMWITRVLDCVDYLASGGV